MSEEGAVLPWYVDEITMLQWSLASMSEEGRVFKDGNQYINVLQWSLASMSEEGTRRPRGPTTATGFNGASPQ